MKRRRKEKHDKACKIARAEGKPRPATPESTSEEEDASDAEAHLPGEYEAATGADSPPVYQEAGDEDAPTAPREARPAPGLLTDPPLAGTERRSPMPAQTASRLQADPRTTPSDQSSRGVSVPRARRSGTGKRSMSAWSG